MRSGIETDNDFQSFQRAEWQFRQQKRGADSHKRCTLPLDRYIKIASDAWSETINAALLCRSPLKYDSLVSTKKIDEPFMSDPSG